MLELDGLNYQIAQALNILPFLWLPWKMIFQTPSLLTAKAGKEFILPQLQLLLVLQDKLIFKFMIQLSTLLLLFQKLNIKLLNKNKVSLTHLAKEKTQLITLTTLTKEMPDQKLEMKDLSN